MLPTSRRSPLFTVVMGIVGIAAIVVISQYLLDRRKPASLGLPNDNSQLIRILRQGNGPIVDDGDLATQMNGSLPIADAQINAAFCVASYDWERDIVLNPAIVLATDPCPRSRS